MDRYLRNPIGVTSKATLNRITANNNQIGVVAGASDMTIANSVISNNSTGLLSEAHHLARKDGDFR